MGHHFRCITEGRKDSEAAYKQRWSLVFLILVEVIAFLNLFIRLLIALAIIIVAIILIYIKLGSLCSLLLILFMIYDDRRGLLQSNSYWCS